MRCKPSFVLLLSVALGGGLVGCASSGDNHESWQTWHDVAAGNATPDNTPAPQAGSTLVIFYRRAAAGSVAAQTPINVYIDGHYQASLISDSYAQTSLCGGQVRLSARPDDYASRYTTKQVGAMFVIDARQSVNYFEVAGDTSGGAVIRPTASPGSIASLGKLQTHTIPRVQPKVCQPST